MSSQVVMTFAFERWLLTSTLTGKILLFWIGGSLWQVVHVAYERRSHMNAMDWPVHQMGYK